MKEKIRIGITHGDFNGISYEIIMKTFSDTVINDFVTPVIYGSSKAAAYYRKALGMEHFNFNMINDASEANAKRTNIVNVSDNVKVEIGVRSQAAGKSSVQALDAAVADLQNNKIDLIVTCPMDKSHSRSEFYAFSGHTEYFADRFKTEDYMMVMVSDFMKVGFVTGNIPFAKVAESIDKDLIVRKLSIINNCLKRDFMIRAPKIAVLSLNPHNGDMGLLGDEEIKIIRPAIDEAKANGILAFGTYAPDGFFASGEFGNFDAILSMHYEQGMIPFRSIGLSQGVNYTAGLPIVRTSPAHGTGYDIAGKGIAQPSSLREAIFLATQIYNNRKMQDEIEFNPLKKKINLQHKTLE